MTLTEISKELGVTTMTVYRRMKKAGINIEELRDNKTGDITGYGASVIASLFPNTHHKGVQQVTTDFTACNTTGNNSTETAVLLAKLEGANALIEQLTNERDELRRQLATITAALQAEQADRQEERKLLTGGDDQRRAGWFIRLFKR